MSDNHGIFPTTEAERNDYYNTACPYLLLAANITRLGISVTHKSDLTSAYGAWQTNYPLCQNPDTRTTTAIDNKNDADHKVQAAMRAIFADIPESILTNTDRNTLHLHLRNTHGTPAPTPNSKPLVKITMRID